MCGCFAPIGTLQERKQKGGQRVNHQQATSVWSLCDAVASCLRATWLSP
jgi:hypothetical protein